MPTRAKEFGRVSKFLSYTWQMPHLSQNENILHRASPAQALEQCWSVLLFQNLYSSPIASTPPVIEKSSMEAASFASASAAAFSSFLRFASASAVALAWRSCSALAAASRCCCTRRATFGIDLGRGRPSTVHRHASNRPGRNHDRKVRERRRAVGDHGTFERYQAVTAHLPR